MSKYSKKSNKKSKKTKRVIKKTILLICEGEKTEDSYFRAFKQDRRKQNVQVVSGYSDPAQLVEDAKTMIMQNEGQYDKIYCIFDRDEHAHFGKAITEIRKFNKSSEYKVQLINIVSNPCFEIWFLLHFKYTTKSFTSSPGGKKVWKKIIEEIPDKQFRKDYRKNDSDIYKKLKDNLKKGVENARNLEKYHKKNADQQNPYTAVHQVVTQVFEEEEG
ncbi:RloB domain-containing protein [Candidatus Peregrinibacteria bacterium]|nr:RloB domain-containing protein [Candidatus Peregrinibacteria bacterium]